MNVGGLRDERRRPSLAARQVPPPWTFLDIHRRVGGRIPELPSKQRAGVRFAGNTTLGTPCDKSGRAAAKRSAIPRHDTLQDVPGVAQGQAAMNESKPDGEKTFLLLGGYGSAGLAIAQLLLEETNVRLIVAGRDEDRARRTASSLNVEHTGNRVGGIRVDAAGDRSALESAFRQCDLVVVCAPLTGIGSQVLEAALAAGVDYVSLNLDGTGSAVTDRLAGRVEQAGLRFITDAGLVPGGPGVLARWAASRFERIDEVIAAMLVREKDISHGSAIDAMTASGTPATVYDHGSWNRAPLTASRKIDFGPPFGVCTCYPFALPEMRPLPERLGVERCGAYAAGMNGVGDALVALWYVLGLGKYPWLSRLGARALVRTNRFTRPPLGVVLAVEVAGVSAGRPLRLRVSVQHDDGYVATAIPALSCLLQVLDGTLKEPGIHMMGHAVDVARFIDDIERLGMKPTEAAL
jgi:short subunit dehydrogenase-like uncharacterized protein